MEHYHTCLCGATISWTSQDVWLLKTGAYIDLTNNSSYAESNHREKYLIRTHYNIKLSLFINGVKMLLNIFTFRKKDLGLLQVKII